MNLKRIIVHQLVKESGLTTTGTILSEELIPNDEKAVNLVTSLLQSYKADKILYAEFDTTPGKYFPEEYKRYKESNRDDQIFINLTRSLIGNLQTIISTKVLARGGYVVFSEYSINGVELSSIFLIRDTEGQILKRVSNGFSIDKIEYLDTRNLAMACRINEDKLDHQENNYLSFTRQKQAEVSDYFKDWISITQLETSTEFTNTLYSIINNLPLPTDPSTNERYSIDEVRNMVYENARNNTNRTINLRTLSEQIYGSPNTITDYVEENNLSLDTEFRYDRRALKRFIQISVRKDGISLKYSRGDDTKVRLSQENPNQVIIESASFAEALRQQLGNE